MTKPEKIAPPRSKSLKVVRIGNSAGVVLPKDVLARLRIELGDELFLTEGQGKLTLSAADANFGEAMAVADDVMREDRDVLSVLAR